MCPCTVVTEFELPIAGLFELTSLIIVLEIHSAPIIITAIIVPTQTVVGSAIAVDSPPLAADYEARNKRADSLVHAKGSSH